jgi:hypothetical protein
MEDKEHEVLADYFRRCVLRGAGVNCGQTLGPIPAECGADQRAFGGRKKMAVGDGTDAYTGIGNIQLCSNCEDGTETAGTCDCGVACAV